MNKLEIVLITSFHYATNNESLLCAKIPFRFHWQHEKYFDNFFLGPGLIPISPCLSNNIKTKNEQQKKIIISVICPMNIHLLLFMEIQDKFA